MEKDDIINLADGEYFIMDVISYHDKDVGFANKIGENDESLNAYKLVEKNENGYSILVDEETINILLPIFEDRITNELLRMKKDGELENE